MVTFEQEDVNYQVPMASSSASAALTTHVVDEVYSVPSSAGRPGASSVHYHTADGPDQGLYAYERVQPIVGVGSLDASTDGPTDAPGPAGTEQPVEFEENGFVLTDEGNSLRIKSVRRGNPAYLNSVYVESEAVGDGAIDEDSSM